MVDSLSVCGTDGVTYPNLCVFEKTMPARRGVHYHSGRCLCDCNCHDRYEPVCAKSGHTYPNACYMECAGDSAKRFIGW